jgi:hypothetical protein
MEEETFSSSLGDSAGSSSPSTETISICAPLELWLLLLLRDAFPENALKRRSAVLSRILLEKRSYFLGKTIATGRP